MALSSRSAKGTPEAIVTDGGVIFYSNVALELYEMLGIRKERIEPGDPWQNYAETLFSIRRRLGDHAFSNARTWPEMQQAHQTWWRNYNDEHHYAHREREDGRHSVTKPIPLPQNHWYASNSPWQRYASGSDYKRSASFRSATRSVDMSG